MSLFFNALLFFLLILFSLVLLCGSFMLAVMAISIFRNSTKIKK